MQGYTKTDIVINKLAGNLYLRTLCYIDYSLLVNDFELRCTTAIAGAIERILKSLQQHRMPHLAAF